MHYVRLLAISDRTVHTPSDETPIGSITTDLAHPDDKIDRGVAEAIIDTYDDPVSTAILVGHSGMFSGGLGVPFENGGGLKVHRNATDIDKFEYSSIMPYLPNKDSLSGVTWKPYDTIEWPHLKARPSSDLWEGLIPSESGPDAIQTSPISQHHGIQSIDRVSRL